MGQGQGSWAGVGEGKEKHGPEMRIFEFLTAKMDGFK
jgi:hypothetical protein